MTERSAPRGSLVEPVVAGIITGIVGFSSSFAVVIAGLRAVGASAAQASSGLFVLGVTMGIGCIVFATAFRTPITMAWSTPGAALLVSAHRPADGFAAAVGAFVITGALLALTGLVPQLASAVRRIPAPIAAAMLGGVLLELCLEPFRDFHQAPWSILLLLLVWAGAQWLLPRWAPLLTLLALVAVIVASGSAAHLALPDGALPHLTATAPHWSPTAAVSIAVPLYLVTMTSQNIPGVTVMRGLGWDIPWRPALAYTGLASTAGAAFGGHAINLSAISATLAAGPQAGADRSRRWVAGVTAGAVYVLLGCVSPVIVALAGAASKEVIIAFAGIALLSALGSALTQAFGADSSPLGPAATLAIAASGVTIGGIGAPFWALLAGCAVYLATTRATALPRLPRPRRARAAADPASVER